MGIVTKNGTALTDEMMEELAQMFERGEWPERTTTIIKGRPLKFNEELHSITFRLPVSQIALIDSAARNQGKSRSDILRLATEKYLKEVI